VGKPRKRRKVEESTRREAGNATEPIELDEGDDEVQIYGMQRIPPGTASTPGLERRSSQSSVRRKAQSSVVGESEFLRVDQFADPRNLGPQSSFEELPSNPTRTPRNRFPQSYVLDDKSSLASSPDPLALNGGKFPLRKEKDCMGKLEDALQGSQDGHIHMPTTRHSDNGKLSRYFRPKKSLAQPTAPTAREQSVEDDDDVRILREARGAAAASPGRLRTETQTPASHGPTKTIMRNVPKRTVPPDNKLDDNMDELRSQLKENSMAIMDRPNGAVRQPNGRQSSQAHLTKEGEGPVIYEDADARQDASNIPPTDFLRSDGPSSNVRTSGETRSRPQSLQGHALSWKIASITNYDFKSLEGPRMILSYDAPSQMYQTFDGVHHMGDTFSFSFRKITRIAWDNSGGTKVRASGSTIGKIPYVFDIDFQEPAYCKEFVDDMQAKGKGTTRVYNKDSWELERMFENRLREAGGRPVDEGQELELLERRSQRREETQQRAGTRTQDSRTNPKMPTMISQLRADVREASVDTAESLAISHGRASESATSGVDRTANSKSVRSTRASTRTNGITAWGRRTSSPLLADEVVKYSVSNGLGRPWSQPVVYPPTGKKRTTVDFHDLQRLDDGEFLNDNLISFYLRWAVEKSPNTEQIERKVYFFNTYFYTTLAKRPKSIDYKSVEKWTAKDDLFSYDYVVVPVNEDAHWYIAIICNLPQIRRATVGEEEDEQLNLVDEIPDSQPEGKSHEVVEIKSQTQEGVAAADNAQSTPQIEKKAATPDPSNNVTKTKAVQGLMNAHNVEFDDGEDIDAVHAKEKPAREDVIHLAHELPRDHTAAGEAKPDDQIEDEWPDLNENPPASSPFPPEPAGKQVSTSQASEGGVFTNAKPNTPAKKAKRKPGPAARKYAVDEPVIIILDSMGLSHPQTARNLKSYLIKEGEAKRGMVVPDLQAMAAKGIPQQPNYWDCGLYLLGYMQKFIDDPDTFVRKILQREFDAETDWPDMNASEMRGNIREILQKIAREQQEERDKNRRKKKKTPAGSGDVALANTESLPGKAPTHAKDDSPSKPTEAPRVKKPSPRVVVETSPHTPFYSMDVKFPAKHELAAQLLGDEPSPSISSQVLSTGPQAQAAQPSSSTTVPGSQTQRVEDEDMLFSNADVSMPDAKSRAPQEDVEMTEPPPNVSATSPPKSTRRHEARRTIPQFDETMEDAPGQSSSSGAGVIPPSPFSGIASHTPTRPRTRGKDREGDKELDELAM